MTDAEIRAGLEELRAEIATALHEGECCPNRPTLRHSDLILLDAVLQRLAQAPAAPPMCEWKIDEDGIYQTACGNSFVFDCDGPVENKQRFCGYCGAVLKAEPRYPSSRMRPAAPRPASAGREE